MIVAVTELLRLANEEKHASTHGFPAAANGTKIQLLGQRQLAYPAKLLKSRRSHLFQVWPTLRGKLLSIQGWTFASWDYTAPLTTSHCFRVSILIPDVFRYK